MEDLNLQWIAQGNTGCNFATLFAKNPESVGWKRLFNPTSFVIPEGALLLSLVFEGQDINSVRQWANNNGFYEEQIDSMLTGLRVKIGNNVSWVQYFGPDSHVVTRKAPNPELLMCVKLPAKYYAKVGFNGVLHLAHASVAAIKDRVAHSLWNSSFRKTEKLIGHKPTIVEAAKSTYYAKE